jgi:hypothetical protein
MSRNGNIRSVENFLVAKTGTTWFNTTNGGDNITDSNDGSIALADGQLGLFSASDRGSVANNVALSATPTAGQAPVVYLAQGTGYSANPGAYPGAKYPLWNRPYERSQDINSAYSVRARKQAYTLPTHSVWTVGQPATTAGEISVLDNTEYQIRIAYRGRRADEFYNPQGTNAFNPHFVTPNYTALGTAEPRDHMLQNLTWNINRNSLAVNVNRTRFKGNEPIVALAIDSTGAAGTEIGGATPIAAGDFLPIVSTQFGVRGITLTEAQAESLKAAALEASGESAIADVTWSVLTIDLATAGTVTGGVADLFMILALDSELAYEDRIPQVKTRLDIGLTVGFDFATVYHQENSHASEGSGEGRVWNLIYKATEGQRKYSLDHTMDPVIEFPSPVVETEKYDSFIFEHYRVADIDTYNTINSPLKTIVLIPTADSGLITEFEDAINDWLVSFSTSQIVD